MLTARRDVKTISRVEPGMRHLIRLSQAVSFGRIAFYVRDGRPDAMRPWRTVRTVKLDGRTNGPRPETDLDDFHLCAEQRALLGQLMALDDGVRVTVEVKQGLPFLMQIEQDHRVL